jgi:hypothetical protein
MKLFNRKTKYRIVQEGIDDYRVEYKSCIGIWLPKLLDNDNVIKYSTIKAAEREIEYLIECKQYPKIIKEIE